MMGHPMRREEYERTYGRRSHMPPVMPPPPQEDPRSRRSRTKMKCLISIGLILPALAAVIGVAAWAVSADVVMNSGNNRANKQENGMLQNYAADNDNRRDILSPNNEIQKIRPAPPPTVETSSTTQSTTSTTTTTTTTIAPAPATLSPQEETDVNAILSKLISASGAASGGSGPRFVVVAPLPDNPEPLQQSPSSTSRIDKPSSTKPHSREDSWQVSGGGQQRPEPELVPASSSQSFHIIPAPAARSTSYNNLTNRMGLSGSETASRRIGPKPMGLSASPPNDRSSGFQNAQIEITGFDPFDSMIQEFQSSQSAPKMQHSSSYVSSGHYPKRGPPQGHYGGRNQHKPLTIQFDPKDQHIFHHQMTEHGLHPLKGSPSHAQSLLAPPPPGVGLKPIQQQLHHIDPLRPEESSRWGGVSFHGPPSHAYVHKPPEGISLSISSPANSGTHVAAAEPVSVIKSFFLPFLPKPRLNMNARVVFGVVLDKGMGLGGDKKSAGHHPYH